MSFKEESREHDQYYEEIAYHAVTVRTRRGSMKNNERGGIISNLFILPAGVALMIGVFFLGYYVGRYQGKAVGQGENASPLPEVVSENLPKPEDFTFYKTLSEKENKTVSIDLRPKSSIDEGKSNKKQVVPEAPQEAADQPASKGKANDMQIEKKSPAADSSKQVAVKKPQAHEKQEVPLRRAAPAKAHYTVQVASYPEKQLADDEAKKMKTRGYAAFIVSSDVPGKGTWYRVRLGSFTNRASAEKLAKDIHAKVGISPIITPE